MISSSSAVREWKRLGVPIRWPKRWLQTWPPTSGKPRPSVSADEYLEAVSLIRVRSLPPGPVNVGHPPTAQTRDRPPQTDRPHGVHRRCSDRTDRYGAAAPNRGAHVSVVATGADRLPLPCHYHPPSYHPAPAG